MWRILRMNLLRKKLRLLLTLGAIAVSFVLFAFLAALLQALSGGVQLTGRDRLITMGQASFFQPLPRNYVDRVLGVEGVRFAMGTAWMNAYYKEPRNRIPTYPMLNEASLLDVYPELRIEPDQWRTWMANRSGALVGRAVQQARGWKLGDVIPLKAAGVAKKDGGNTWEVKIDGIFDNDSGNTNGVYLHFDYFNESLAKPPNTITWIVLRVEDKSQSEQVAARIDQMFGNSSAETNTSSENSFTQEIANQMGSIGSIIALILFAVFFTMLLIAANTMSQAIRERIGEIALMKAVGFGASKITALVLAEAVLIMLLGGALGLMFGASLVKTTAASLKQFLPLMGITPLAYLSGIGLMVVAGLVSGALPCWQAAQLRITDALRRA